MGEGWNEKTYYPTEHPLDAASIAVSPRGQLSARQRQGLSWLALGLWGYCIMCCPSYHGLRPEGVWLFEQSTKHPMKNLSFSLEHLNSQAY